MPTVVVPPPPAKHFHPASWRTAVSVLLISALAVACGVAPREASVRSTAALSDEELALVREAIDEQSLPTVDRFGVPVDTLDRRVIVRWLKEARYDSLTAELSARWRTTRQDIKNEMLLYNAFDSFFQASGSLQPHLERWRTAQPDRAEPLIAEAYYRYGRAVAARGDGTARQTDQGQFAEMQREVALSRDALDRALRLAPGHIIVHFVRMNLLKIAGAPDEATARDIVRAAVQENPASFLIRDQVLVLLQPRWGGSLEAMREFAEASHEMIPMNAQLALLAGRPAMEEARMARDLPTAVALLDRAASHGEDFSLAIAYQDIYHENDQFVQALAAGRRARAFLRQGRSEVEDRGHLLLHVALLMGESPLRDSLFTLSRDAIRLGLAMSIPNAPGARDMARWQYAKEECAKNVGIPCADVF